MYDTTAAKGPVLETIDESNLQSCALPVRSKSGARRKRSDITLAERQAVVWFRTQAFNASSVSDDSSTNSLEDFSSNSLGPTYIVETPSVSTASSVSSVSSASVVSQSAATVSVPKKEKKKSKKQAKKSLRFDCDEQGDVRCDILEFKKVKESIHCDIWFTDEELASFRQGCVDTVLAFKENEQFLWAVSVLYNATWASAAEFNRACKLYQQHHAGRGLEIHISDMANAVVKRQQRVVLKKPREAGELKRKSKFVTKHSAAFAHQIAQIDAILAFV